MSLLSIVRDAADAIGVVRPATVISSTDQQVIRLLGCAQEEGKALMSRHDWKVLQTEKTFTATATTVQDSAIPSDLHRFINETFFNRTRKRPVYGPLSPQEWQFSQSVVATVLVESFRERGNDFMLTPTPTAGDTYAYEYISENWCQDSDGVGQARWAADTDTGVLSEDLMTLGIIWRFKQKQGLGYAEEFRTYELQVADAIMRDGGKRTLNAGSTTRGTFRPRAPFVQEGSWNIT